MANLETVLLLDKVEKTYNPGRSNAITVFQNLSMNVKAGEVVGLIAPSGSGKSTLLNLAGLLDNPNSGHVFVNGLDMSDADDEERTQTRRDHVGFVFQFHHLLAEFTALENVMLPLLSSGEPRKEAQMRASQLLDNIGLGDRLKHRPSAMSGGEQQRVAICRALANKPKILLADEPTGNLDQENSNRVFDIFVKLAREDGLAALVATHNMELASKMDRVIDLRDLSAKAV